MPAKDGKKGGKDKDKKTQDDKEGGKKSKKKRDRKCVGQCYATVIVPPDYTKTQCVRDWQMSPFSNERFDLDEIQRLEKKGFKGRAELEALKKRLQALAEQEQKTVSSRSSVFTRPVATPEMDFWNKGFFENCSSEILYQPYGPLMVPVRSYARPFSSRHSVYCYLGPSYFSAYRFKVPAPGMVSPIPCPEPRFGFRPEPYINTNFSNLFGTYIPLGP